MFADTHTHATKNITSMAEVITHYFGVHHGFSTFSDNTYVMMTILTFNKKNKKNTIKQEVKPQVLQTQKKTV